MARDNVEFVARIPEGVDMTDLDVFANGFPHDVFSRLRAVAPVLWHAPTAHTPDGEGFWSVHTHAARMTVVHDPGAFSSETGGTRPFSGTTLNDLPMAGLMLNMTDDPRIETSSCSRSSKHTGVRHLPVRLVRA